MSIATMATVSNADRLEAMYEQFWGEGDWRAGIDMFADTLGQVWEFENGKVVRQTIHRTSDEARQAARGL